MKGFFFLMSVGEILAMMLRERMMIYKYIISVDRHVALAYSGDYKTPSSLITVTCVSFSILRSSYVTCAQHACRSSLCRNVTPVAAVATYIRRGPQYRSLCTGVSRWFGRCAVSSLWVGRLESRASISCRGGTSCGALSLDSCQMDTECICYMGKAVGA
jgi:hypothetical protein